MITLKTLHHSPKLAELKVSYKRRNGAQRDTSKAITSPETAAEYLRKIWDRDRLELVEDFYVVCLNSGHEAIGWVRASSGGFDRTIVDPKFIFGVALQTASSAIIVAHNHPSGRIQPSGEDLAVTERLKSAGKVLNIPLLDHIILGKDSAYSFEEEGFI